MSIPENPSLEEFLTELNGNMRILGVTDTPQDLRQAENGSKMAACKELLKQAQALPAGRSVLVEFTTRNELNVMRVNMHRLKRYLDIPLKIHTADTLMWVSLEQHNEQP